MGLIKHRPKISLLLQREIYPGGSYSAQVVITARREVPVDFIKLSLDGEVRGVIGGGKSRQLLRRPVLGLGARLSGPRTLPPGRTELPFRFDIPAGVPLSYRGQLCAAEYIALVHASIPWWPDAKAAFDIFVTLPPVAQPEDDPLLFSSDPSGPRAREPHIEGSLTSSVVPVGGTVEGALALNNVAYNPYSSLEIGLVGLEEVLQGGQVRARFEAHRYGLVLPVEAPAEGVSVPFSFRVPETLTPSYDSGLWRLRWDFEVRARIAWRQDLHFRVPMTVVTSSAGGGRTRRSYRAPPSVGSERVEKLWRLVAEELDLHYETGRISGEEGEVSFEIVREHRGRRGVFLLGLLSYPDLHLGLRLEPRDSSIRRLVAGVFSDDDAFDHRYDLSGRDPDQVAHVSGVLGPWVETLDSLRADDRQATAGVLGAGQRRERLRAFCSTVRALSGNFDALRKEIPPPRPMGEGLEAWTTLADRLSGTLEKARMAIHGHFHAMPAEVRTDWTAEGQAERTLLILKPNVVFSKDLELHLTPSRVDDRSLSIEDLPEATRSMAGLIEPILADADAFVFSGEEVRLSLPAPMLDPLPLLERLALMAQLCEMARAGKGPFR